MKSSFLHDSIERAANSIAMIILIGPLGYIVLACGVDASLRRRAALCRQHWQ